MKRRIFGLWLASLLVSATIAIGYVARRVRLAEEFQDPNPIREWDALAGLLAVAFGTFTALAVLLLFSFIGARVNVSRAVNLHGDTRFVIAIGIRNFELSRTGEGVLSKVESLGSWNTIMSATGDGLSLISGFAKALPRVSFTWAQVEKIESFALAPPEYNVRGRGVSVFIAGFSQPLRFGLIERRFPWIDLMSDPEVEEIVARLRAYKETATLEE